MTTSPDTTHPEPVRYPRATVRLRYGKKMLRHGLALGWRTEWDGPEFPVTVDTLDARAEREAACAA